MGKFGAWIRPGDRRDRVRFAEQETQHVEVMHAHIGEGQPVVFLEETLPVRNRPHLDGRYDDRPELASVEDLLQNPHRLVIAHILVDREYLAGACRLVPQGLRFVQRERQWLLREDCLDMRLRKCFADQRRLLVGRKGNVENLDVRIGYQSGRRRMNGRNFPTGGDGLCPLLRA